MSWCASNIDIAGPSLLVEMRNIGTGTRYGTMGGWYRCWVRAGAEAADLASGVLISKSPCDIKLSNCCILLIVFVGMINR